jgi:hypothetical protein
MQNPEPRRQTPEETLNRIAGVPKSPEELEAERQQLDAERTAQVQRNAGVYPNDQPNNRTSGQPNASHAEQERERQSSTRSTSSDKA